MTHTLKNNDGEYLRIPSGAEVYDALMSRIEPDLVSSNIPLLDEKYKNESEAGRAERYKRYSIAFERVKKEFAKWHKELHGAIAVFYKNAMKTAESHAKNEEVHALSSLEQQLSVVA
jgi:hypothetical protein